VALLHPLLTQLVIRWAGSSNNRSSFTLFFIHMWHSTYSKMCKHSSLDLFSLTKIES